MVTADIITYILIYITLFFLFAGFSFLYGFLRGAFESLKELLQDNTAISESVFTELSETELWFTTRCETCKHEVTFDDPIEPGQVSVVRCSQCGDAWAAVLPSVYVVKADRLELKQEQLIREV